MMSTKQEIESTGLTEIELLEAAFSEELRCESGHGEACPECSVEVVAVKLTACGSRFMVCEISRDWNISKIADGGGRCKNCKSSVSECWKIIPI